MNLQPGHRNDERVEVEADMTNRAKTVAAAAAGVHEVVQSIERGSAMQSIHAQVLSPSARPPVHQQPPCVQDHGTQQGQQPQQHHHHYQNQHVQESTQNTMEEAASSSAIFGVFDGHRGHQAAQFCASYLELTFRSCIAAEAAAAAAAAPIAASLPLNGSATAAAAAAAAVSGAAVYQKDYGAALCRAFLLLEEGEGACECACVYVHGFFRETMGRHCAVRVCFWKKVRVRVSAPVCMCMGSSKRLWGCTVPPVSAVLEEGEGACKCANMCVRRTT